MADEATINVTLSFTKNGFTQSVSSGNVTVDVAGNIAIRAIQNVGTADELLQVGDVATAGLVLFHNLDATNFVSIGTAPSNYLTQVFAGEYQLLRLTTNVIHVKADTAAVNLEYFLLEE